MVLLQEGQFINCPYKLEHISKQKPKATESKHTIIQNGFPKFQYLKYTTVKEICWGEKSLAS